MENTIHFSLINAEYETALSELTSLINTQETRTYIIDFQSEYGNSKIIRDFVGKIFDAFEIIHPWRGRFVLITDELINNSIEHGSEDDDTNRCIISAGNNTENGDFHISIEIHDTGKKQKNQPIDMPEIKENRLSNN